ncbi:MAG: aldo/keto reductase [Blastomonas sp.]
MTLPHRQIGPFKVSAVTVGCMALSHAYDVPPSEADAVRFLNHALDSGITMLDTAAIYGAGANESLLGKAVMHRRREFVLASKCVLDLVDGKRVLDGRPEVITRSLENSLRRLGTDHIDLFYLHRLDRDVPVEESVGALVRAREAGKIGHIGLSEMSADTVRRVHAVHPIAAVQSEYSICVRNPEIAVLDACAELGIGFVAFSPVVRGLLSRAIRSDDYARGDIRLGMPRFVEPNLSHNLKAVAEYEALADARGISPAQLAIAWLLSRRPFLTALVGTRTPVHLDENLGALDVTLDGDTLAAIDRIFAPGTIRGARYNGPTQAQIDTETFADEDLD